MAGRYKNNEIKKLSDCRRVYRSKVYPNIPLRDDDKYVVTQTGDRLDICWSTTTIQHCGGL